VFPLTGSPPSVGAETARLRREMRDASSLLEEPLPAPFRGFGRDGWGEDGRPYWRRAIW
jgi:hypothetical protein